MKNRKSNITDKPISKDVATRVEDKIIRARVDMLLKHQFFGVLITRLQIQPADAWIPTMAVDGKYLYYNHAFVDSLTLPELKFVFAHEIFHLVYDHLGRKEFRDARLYNCAADYIVNDELIQYGIGKMPSGDKSGLHDIKYRGWSSEAVYEDLNKQMQKNKGQNQAQGSGNGQGSANGMTLDELVDKLLDEHLSGEEESDGKDGQPGKNGPAQMTDEQRKQLKSEIQQAVINAAKTCDAGSLPAGIERMINELTNPKIDWRTLLRSQLESLVLNDYSWMRVSRTGWDIDAILPGQKVDEELKIAVAIDMSGSISEQMGRDLLSEVVGIMDQFPSYEILVMTYDTEIYNPQVFTNDNSEEIRSYKIKGGGGTDYNCIYDYLKQEDITPMKLINCTDGWPGSGWGDEHYCDTLFLLSGTKTIVPPFGVYTYLD